MLKLIESLKNKKLIGIEGEPGTGKTTFANQLKTALNANVVSIDDFYKPEFKRNELSFKKGGNNIDYERFIQQVIKPFLENKEIVYQKYNCQTDGYEAFVSLKHKPILVVEGSYCLAKRLFEYYDYKILLSIDDSTQISRLKTRNNFEDFIDIWIPLSKAFIKENQIKELIDIEIENYSIN